MTIICPPFSASSTLILTERTTGTIGRCMLSRATAGQWHPQCFLVIILQLCFIRLLAAYMRVQNLHLVKHTSSSRAADGCKVSGQAFGLGLVTDSPSTLCSPCSRPCSRCGAPPCLRTSAGTTFAFAPPAARGASPTCAGVTAAPAVADDVATGFGGCALATAVS